MMLWHGAMHAANDLGVDIIQKCEVTGPDDKVERLLALKLVAVF